MGGAEMDLDNDYPLLSGLGVSAIGIPPCDTTVETTNFWKLNRLPN
jgi:hypothetical protein